MPYTLYCPESGSHVDLSHEQVCAMANGGGVGDTATLPTLVALLEPSDRELPPGFTSPILQGWTQTLSVGDHGVEVDTNGLFLAPLRLYQVVVSAVYSCEAGSGGITLQLQVQGLDWQSTPLSVGFSAAYTARVQQSNFVFISETGARQRLTLAIRTSTASVPITLNRYRLIVSDMAEVP